MVDESLPKSWLIHEVKVTPPLDGPNGWQDSHEDDGFIIHHCRVDSNDAITTITEGTGGTATAVQGTYTLYIDAKNSYPLDRLPAVNDQVTWSDGYSNFSAMVMSVASLYNDTGINHWEVGMQ